MSTTKVLVAVDLGHDPWSVVDQVQPWADRMNAVVDVISAVTPPIVPSASAELRALLEYQASQIDQDRRSTLERLLGRLSPEARGDAFAIEGKAADVIVEAATRYDLLVVGTHGRSGLARVWLGSVAEQVVRRASVPVLVVRA